MGWGSYEMKLTQSKWEEEYPTERNGRKWMVNEYWGENTTDVPSIFCMEPPSPAPQRSECLVMRKSILKSKHTNKDSFSFSPSGWHQRFAFLSSSQTMLMLLIQAPHSKNCCSSLKVESDKMWSSTSAVRTKGNAIY